MENIRNSKILKILSYLFIPIIVLIILATFLYQLYIIENRDEIAKKDYFKTEKFANQYYNYLVQKIEVIQKASKEKDTVEDSYISRHYNLIEEGNQKVYYERNTYYYNNYSELSEAMEYLILNKENNTIFTNIRVENANYEEKIQEMQNQKIYWYMMDGNIQTSVESVTENSLKYENGTRYVRDLKNKNMNIYTTLNQQKIQEGDKIYLQKQIYDEVSKLQSIPSYLLPISIILLLIMSTYLIIAIGHEKGKEGITLKAMDKVSYEIIFLISFFFIALFMQGAFELTNETKSIFIVGFLFCYLICYISFAILTVTTIKRIKAKKFLASFLTYKFIKWIQNKGKMIKEEISDRTSEGKKIIFYYSIFLIISLILIVNADWGLSIILLVTFWIWVLYKMIQYQKQMSSIKLALKNIYEGNNEIHLKQEELKGTLKEMAKYIEDIAGGFSNAIEESLKSERLKTELITNVSHDIKTPLTSIINYVDLLKKEEIEDEKIKEYITILDNKSQRLKKLIEDLVEASKVSSGNVQLTIEKINLKELLNQTIGEFEDRFQQKGLQVEIELPKEEVKIKADNRYMYRIIENLFSNITKYALENSRIYIKLENTGYEIKLQMKNISKEKLNISAEELMQRFVRGDKSRYTEGSGLGLSIAQSLTELQGGKFELKIDGDLFKVEIAWNKNNE